jgi:acyl dehydratase
LFDTSKIGYSFSPFSITLERGKIHELALAIGDDNPIYHDRLVAQEAQYEDVPLLPTIGTQFMFWGNSHFVEQLSELGLDVPRIIHLEESYEYLAPLYAGETLTAQTTVLEGATRKGPRNAMIDFVTLQIRYTNQHKQPVLIAKSRFVVR